MSCSQVAPEFSGDKFKLKYEHPVSFWVWRCICFPQDRSFAVYRVLFAATCILLLILDFLWIVGFAGAGETNRLSACLDAGEFALIGLCLACVLLACGANRWHQVRWETNAETTIPYKPAWFFYTVSVNAVYVTMILFWVSIGPLAPLEQQLKYTIPGCLILFDLCLTGVPLCLCHVIYVILFYYGYLAVAGLALFLSYTFGIADKNSRESSNPTVWIAGYPFLPNGYSDFTNIHRILGTIFGSIALAVVVHCLLLSIVILRDFLGSLFRRSTALWIDNTGLNVTSDPQLTDRFFTQSTAPSTSSPTQPSLCPPVVLSTTDEKPPPYEDMNTTVEKVAELKQ
ncbi:hypothetical protein D915_000667 [Fasciola hepatica]|uniref:Uncharacterized protein n=1 Tax=Fasciola hepatica TaxID=6192 RepID=A0A4E0RNJ7_FASHE|nr:hypothetical protein D915_000667 [Fasciola hepatica]